MYSHQGSDVRSKDQDGSRPLSASTSYTEKHLSIGADTVRTFDTLTFENINNFPRPPSGIPPTAPPLASSPRWRGPGIVVPPPPSTLRTFASPNHRSAESYSSSNSFSTNQEEILQDEFIANLLHGRANNPSAGPHNAWFDENLNYISIATDSKPLSESKGTAPSDPLRFVPASPTLTARTGKTLSAGGILPPPLLPPPPLPTPPLPTVPSPLLKHYYDSSDGSALPSPQSPSFTSHQTSSDARSNRTRIVRASQQALSPSGSVPTVLGYARAAYIPKTDVSTSPSARQSRLSSVTPLTIPHVLPPSNLIDLPSPGLRPHSPLSPQPHIDEFAAQPSPSSEHLLLPSSAGAGPSRSRTSTLNFSLRNEAPPNVPVDVETNESEVPPSSYIPSSNLHRYPSKSRKRFSMSSLLSRLSRSTQSSTSHKAWKFAWTSVDPKDRQQLPPLPSRADEIEKRESELPLPALVSRAGFLQQMLESGRLPRNSMSTYRAGSTRQDSDNSPNPDWDSFRGGPGYVDPSAYKKQTAQSIRSFFTRSTSDRRSERGAYGFNVLDEELERRYQQEIAASFSRSSHLASGENSERDRPLPPIPSGEKRRTIIIADQPRPARSPPLRMYEGGFGLGHLTSGWSLRKQILIAVVVLVVLIAAIVGLAVGLSTRKSGSKVSDVGVVRGANCAGNMTGSICDLDATCVCTSNSAAQCNPLAQSILSMIPTTNNLFNTTFTPSSVALSFWDIEGTPVGGNCASQALMIDTSSTNKTTTIDSVRSTWARSAVLFSLIKSEDAISSEDLRKFAASLDYSNLLPKGTGRSEDTSLTGGFQRLSAGFVYDFDKMTVTAPPVTWKDYAKPSEAQTVQVGSDMEKALDRMYTSANALSAQAQVALKNYWTHDLQQKESDLLKLFKAFRNAPVMLPFDMTLNKNGKSYSTIMQRSNTNSARISFPPPLGCSPMISEGQLDAVNVVEGIVFGLNGLSSEVKADFEEGCFGSRPVYGVLDVLRLRVPFMNPNDKSSGGPVSNPTAVPGQALVLGTDATTRVVVRSGKLLSTLPGDDSSTVKADSDVPAGALDVSNYGTMDYMAHVILTWLRSMPVDVGMDVATYLIGAPSTTEAGAVSSPPPPPSNLLNSKQLMSSIPTLEVALFGTLGTSDVSYGVSSFATPSSSLFFGSSTGNVFRQYVNGVASNEKGYSIVWSQSPTSEEVVRENKVADESFDATWNGAATLIGNANTVGSVTGDKDVQTVVDVFESIGYMSP
ncbi:hypothetical protein FRC03_011587 [Tulasnella sp. 419]|nr:hypothetical protein FRC03_011587 [Tulasnella sp. 419]